MATTISSIQAVLDAASEIESPETRARVLHRLASRAPTDDAFQSIREAATEAASRIEHPETKADILMDLFVQKQAREKRAKTVAAREERRAAKRQTGK